MNDLDPGYIKLFYSSNGHGHEMVIPVRYDGTPTPGTEPNVLQSGGTPQAVTAALTAFITVIKPYIHTSGSFTGFECYKKLAGSDPVFLYGNDLAIAGTGVTAATPYGQVVFTFRTSVGGILKIYVMEPITAPNTRSPIRTTSGAPLGALATYMLGATALPVGRDEGVPIFGMWSTSKVNDALRKKFLLDT